MITIENSDLVNWCAYPDYICALVMCNKVALETRKGLVMPKGTEFVFLLDKIPSVVGGKMAIVNTKIYCLDGFGPDSDGEYPFEPLELHIKPRPVTKIKKSQESKATA